jgi:hypothetical protein
MFGKLIAGILSLSLCLAAPASFAASRQDKGSTSTSQGPRRHLTTIVMSGLAGAILGLSTLSFYGRPQDKLSNIATGFAIGIVIGAAYTTYKAAAEPKDFYSARDPNAQAWKLADNSKTSELPKAPRATFVFQF